MPAMVLNKSTARQLDMAELDTKHGYLFLGPAGLGKTSSAKYFAVKKIGPDVSQGDLARWIMTISPIDDKKISIDQVRPASDFINKSKPEHVNYRVLIIDHAELLSPEAANSLLLLVEEPPAATLIIFVSDSADALPSTILSRLQKISFYPPIAKEIEPLLSSLEVPIWAAEAIGPFPAKLIAASQDGYKSIASISEIADKFISTDTVGRLIIAASLEGKADLRSLVSAIALKLYRSSPSPAWLKQSNSLIFAQSHLYNNGNPKFIIESLAMEFE